MNTINGRTPEEIKLGLVHCLTAREYRNCLVCPYGTPRKRGMLPCDCEVRQDILALIDQLLEDKKQTERERNEARNDLDTLSYANTELHSAYEAMKRERDAAVEALCEIDETLIRHNSTGTHGCMNEVRKAVNDGLIGVICAREVKPDEQVRT